jgi:sortase (surface protein transpeptidase)
VFQHPMRARFLLAAGMTGALLLLPGSAWAADDGVATVPTDVTDVTDVIDVTVITETTTSSPSTTPSPPPFEIPEALEDAFARFAEQAGISQECVDEVTASLEQIARGLTTPPAPPEDVVAEIEAALGGLGEAPTPEDLEALLAELEGLLDPQDNDVAHGLERLGAALASEECRPAVPAPPTSSAAPTGGAGHPGSGYSPPAHTSPTPHPTPQAAPQTVTYLGYAPTGAERDSSALAPVAALGGLALVAGAGALGHRRWRAPVGTADLRTLAAYLLAAGFALALLLVIVLRPADAPPAGGGAPTPAAAGQDPGAVVPAWLAIPAIGVDAAVEHRGTTTYENPFTGQPVAGYGVPEALTSTSWWSDGPQPGSGGMAVLLGHQQDAGEAVFNRLHDLREGDEVRLQDDAGTVLRLAVLGAPVTGLDKATSALSDVLNGHPADADVALVTCGGEFDDAAGTSTQNTVVFATVVG